MALGPADPLYDTRGPTVFDLPQHRWLVGLVQVWSGTFLLEPWFYFALALVCPVVAFATRHPDRWSVALLGASAVGHGLSFALVGSHTAFRYIWWPAVAAVTQVYVLAAGLRERG